MTYDFVYDKRFKIQFLIAFYYYFGLFLRLILIFFIKNGLEWLKTLIHKHGAITIVLANILLSYK